MILKVSPYELVLAKEGNEDAWFPSSWELEDIGITAVMVDGYRLCITAWVTFEKWLSGRVCFPISKRVH